MCLPIKLIIFDLDGTLVDAYQAVARSLNYAFQKVGLPALDDNTIKNNVGWGDRNLIRRFIAEEDLDKVLRIYRRHHKKALKTGTKFLPGAKKIVLDLERKGYKLAVASNRPTFFTQIILKHLKVMGCFDYVLCADKVQRPKPAGDMLKQILKKLSVSAKETLYIGDMTIDIQCGQAAGIRTVAVATGSSTPQEIRPLKPFKMIRRIHQLNRVLNQMH